MTASLDKAYDPTGVEERWYRHWSDAGLFRGVAGDGDPFCVVIPPPNVTGALHMGHALNNTIQDVLVRRARMQGRPTLWVPGTDHAAIATQNVIERRLADEGKSRHDLGREAFEERFWEWKDVYEARILGQLQRLGCSCDWSRTRFTMDEGLSRAVRTVFVRLYEEGRIYRGNRIINWCPRCTSALSDIEVRHEDVDGELVTLRYPLSDGSGFISVSTTRVETMLGDTGVAVHPDDDRYRGLVGRTVRLPLQGRDIPIVADEAVDPEFGTGAVKVTPAHDPNDFEIAQRHGLPAVNVFTASAVVNADGGRFEGMERYEARRAVLDALQQDGAVGDVRRPYAHAVGHCDRCGTEVEPWLSEQWFVAMRELAAPAIEAVRERRTRLHPERPFEKTYLDWMTNIRDWCISRQIWVGHRIPVWYCPDGHMTVALGDPDACATCGSDGIEQDPDTLDTWFSSQLWPFSTLGWPEDTDDLRDWYPTSVLVTGYDILYLWVARMITMGLHFRGDVPFHDVVLTGLIRDWEGKKMSKSLGNIIDPLDLIDRYGTDALRFTLARTTTPGQDTNLAEDWIEGDRRFCNKLWNASRFVLAQIGDFEPGAGAPSPSSLPERWILSRLAQTVAAVDGALERFEFGEAARTIHQFLWSELCDWFLEVAKIERTDTLRSVLYEVLETALRLAHPIMPFITEEIWQRLPRRAGDPASIMVAAWPSGDGRIDGQAEEEMEFLQTLVVEVRRFRHEHGVAPATRIDAKLVAPTRWAQLVRAHERAVCDLARLASVEVVAGAPGDGWSRVVAGAAEAYLPLTAVQDVQAEVERLDRQIAQAGDRAERARAKLASEGFVSRAPADIVDGVRRQLAEADDRVAKLRAQRDALADA